MVAATNTTAAADMQSSRSSHRPGSRRLRVSATQIISPRSRRHLTTVAAGTPEQLVPPRAHPSSRLMRARASPSIETRKSISTVIHVSINPQKIHRPQQPRQIRNIKNTPDITRRKMMRKGTHRVDFTMNTDFTATQTARLWTQTGTSLTRMATITSAAITTHAIATTQPLGQDLDNCTGESSGKSNLPRMRRTAAVPV